MEKIIEDKYIIDIRCGCAAILDTESEAFQEKKDGIRNGLHSDDPDVVFYVNYENLSSHKGYPVKYFESMSRVYAEMYRLATGDELPKEIAAMEKQPEYEYVKVKSVFELDKEEVYKGVYGQFYDTGEFYQITGECELVSVLMNDKLLRRVEITPEQKREREVEELGRELWQMHNDTMTEMRILPSKNQAWERGSLTDEQKKIWIETARKWMESKK